MLGLRDLQIGMRDALLGRDAAIAAREIAADGLDPAARLDIYRHHVFTTLTAALRATYQVVCRLVDERFFAFAADAYIRAHPPTDPCLFEYGTSFPDFLAEFVPSRGLPYLPDVARLEWAMNVAWHAEDVAPLDPGRLVALSETDMPRLTFTFEPSVSFIASPWPVDHIWRANQDEDSTAAVDLGTGGARLEIRRLDGVVTMRALGAGDHALRTALARGATLEQAAGGAMAADPCFALTPALRDLVEERIFIDFAVSN